MVRSDWFNVEYNKIAFCIAVIWQNLEGFWLNFVGDMTNGKSFDVLDCEHSNINHRYSCFQKNIVWWTMLVESFDNVIRYCHLRLLLLLVFLWWFFGCHLEELSWSWEMLAHKACNLIVLLQWCCNGDVELGVVKLRRNVCRMGFLRSAMSQCSQIDDNCAWSTQNWTLKPYQVMVHSMNELMAWLLFRHGQLKLPSKNNDF